MATSSSFGGLPSTLCFLSIISEKNILKYREFCQYNLRIVCLKNTLGLWIFILWSQQKFLKRTRLYAGNLYIFLEFSLVLLCYWVVEKGTTSSRTSELNLVFVLWQANAIAGSSSFDAFWFTRIGHSILQGLSSKNSVCDSLFCGFDCVLFLKDWRTSALPVVQELQVVLNL